MAENNDYVIQLLVRAKDESSAALDKTIKQVEALGASAERTQGAMTSPAQSDWINDIAASADRAASSISTIGSSVADASRSMGDASGLRQWVIESEKAVDGVKGFSAEVAKTADQTKQSADKASAAMNSFFGDPDKVTRPFISFDAFTKEVADLEKTLERPARSLEEVRSKIDMLSDAERRGVYEGDAYDAALKELEKQHTALAKAAEKSAKSTTSVTKKTVESKTEIQRMLESVKEIEHASHKGFGSMWMALDKIKVSASAAVVAMAGLAAAVFGIALVGKQVEKAAASALESSEKLKGMLEATGHQAGITAEQVTELGMEMQQTMGISVDAVEEAGAALAAFENIKGDNFIRTLQAAGDISAATGRDIRGTAQMLARALDTPGEYLSYMRRIGITVSDTTERMAKALQEQGRTAEAQAIILDELGGKYAHLGEKMGSTIAGAHRRIGLSMHQMLKGNEETQHRISEAWDKIADAVSNPETVRALTGLASAFGDFWAMIVGGAGSSVAALLEMYTRFDKWATSMEKRANEMQDRLKNTFIGRFFAWYNEQWGLVDEKEEKRKRVRGGRPLAESFGRDTSQNDAEMKALDARKKSWEEAFSEFASDREKAEIAHRERIEQIKDQFSESGERADRLALEETNYRERLKKISDAEAKEAQRRTDIARKMTEEQKALYAELSRAAEASTPNFDAYRDYEDTVNKLVATRDKLVASGGNAGMADDKLMAALKVAADKYLITLDEIDEKRQEIARGVMAGLLTEDEAALASLGDKIKEIWEVYGDSAEVASRMTARAFQMLEDDRIEAARRANEEMLEQQTEFARRAAETLQDAFSDIFMNIGNSWKDWLRSLLTGFQQIFAQRFGVMMAEALQLPGTKAGGTAGKGILSDWLGKLFGSGGGKGAAGAQKEVDTGVDGGATNAAAGCAEKCAGEVVQSVSETLGGGIADRLKEFGTGIMQTIKIMTSGLWKFITTVLNKIWDFIKAAIDAIRTMASASSGGSSTGGFIASLVGMFAGGSAGGGIIPAGKPRRVGEEGEEWIVPLVPSKVINERQMAFAGGGGGSLEYAPSYTITINGAKDDRAMAQQLMVYVERQDQKNKVEIMEMLRRNGYGRMTR